jgi:adenylate cyclase
MQEALVALNTSRAKRAEAVLAMGIGLHSGLAVIGDIGSERRLEYTAVGDTVNVSSRVETLTKQLNVPVLATAATRELADGAFAWTPMLAAKVIGKHEPVVTYAPARLVLTRKSEEIWVTSE